MALSREDFMKKLTSILATMALGVGLISTPVIAQDKGTIGIAMPTKSSARWISDGNSMVEQFTAAGYATDLQYAEDDIPNQLAQIENMITKGVDVLVIAAIDGTTLSNALENASASGIKVIAYDRLIRDSGACRLLRDLRQLQGWRAAGDQLGRSGLKERFGDGPYNVELFGGSPDDNNAYFFYDGAMSVLQPLIDSGTINIVSGQMGMDTVGTLALGRRGRPGAHGQPAVGALHRQARVARRAVTL
jgi:putative multiple sugar transport system substrate-binding protein